MTARWLRPHRAAVLLAGACVAGPAAAMGQAPSPPGAPAPAAPSVSGTIVFNGRAPRSRLVDVMLRSVTGTAGAWAFWSLAAPAFSLDAVRPGRYELDAVPSNPIETWRVETIVVDGRDVTGRPFDIGTSDIDDVVITMTDRPATVTGTIRGGSGEARAQMRVGLFPVDRAAWADAWPGALRFRLASADRSTYSIAPVLKGEYFIATLSDTEAADWPTPALLATLASRAARVVVSEGRTYFVSVETK